MVATQWCEAGDNFEIISAGNIIDEERAGFSTCSKIQPSDVLPASV